MRYIQCFHNDWTTKFFRFLKEDEYYYHRKDWNICVYFLKYKHPNYIYIEKQKTWKEYFIEWFEQFLDIILVICDIALKVISSLRASKSFENL